MKNMTISRFSCVALVFVGFAFLVGCAEFPGPYSSGSGYGDYPPSPPVYRGYHSDDDYYRRHELERERHNEWERDREHELDRERAHEREEAERHRREEEREREAHHVQQAPPPPPLQTHCPPGYQPSEQKCSPEERRRGCKDVRLNSGMGCVHR